MSDYIGHLVSRVLFPATGVQPRLPSVFEPHSRPDVADAEPGLTVATAPRAIQRQAATHARRDELFEVGPETPFAREARVPDQPTELAAPDRDADSRAVLTLEHTAVLNAGELSPVTSPRDLAGPRFDQHTEPVIATASRTADPVVHASTSPVALPASSGDPSGRHAIASASDVPFARLDRPRAVLEPPATRPHVVAAHVGSKSARLVRAQPAVTRDVGDAEHTIHVSIGRVEIRAASAPPASRSSAPASSAMTLSEYLRQRRVPGER